jgi:lysophospholipase L1-like esterase
LRIAVWILLGAAGLSASACSKLGGTGSPTAPSLPPAAGSTIVYSAVGASDVIGYGSSRPCIPFEDCNGNGYVWVAARSLRGTGYTVNVFSRGWPGAVISRSLQDLGNQSGHEVTGNLTEQCAPFVSPDSTLVTVFAGVNDVNTITAAAGTSLAGTNPSAFIDSKVDTFLADYNTVLSIVRSRAPNAQIVVFNVPNVGAIPALAGASLAQKQAAQRASVRMTNGINTLANVRVVDVMCDARFYQASNVSSDGLHPNDNGYALLGSELATAVTSASYPAPKSACAQMTAF